MSPTVTPSPVSVQLPQGRLSSHNPSHVVNASEPEPENEIDSVPGKTRHYHRRLSTSSPGASKITSGSPNVPRTFHSENSSAPASLLSFFEPPTDGEQSQSPPKPKQHQMRPVKKEKARLAPVHADYKFSGTIRGKKR